MATRRSVQKKFVRKADAPPTPVDIAPADSVLQRTACFIDEVVALRSKDLASFNFDEVMTRTALLGIMSVERYMRDPNAPLKDRADMGLKALNTFANIKSRSTLFEKKERDITPIDVEAYNVEFEDTKKRIEELSKRARFRNSARLDEEADVQ